MISKKLIDAVSVLLEGSGPNSSGWWSMYCPYHGDSHRSAGLQVEDGRFRCQGCGETKTVEQLVKDKEEWIVNVPGYKASGEKSSESVTNATIAGWHSALMSDSERLNALMARRGLSVQTIRHYELGWAREKNAYTIPVRGSELEILNIRFYQLDPTQDRRKIWGMAGRNEPVLWPLDQLDSTSIVICEGEMDAMLTIQNGIPAITRTGAADVWRSEWSKMFSGKNVYVCHDMDTKGQSANSKIKASTRQVAERVMVVKLPFEVTEKNGKDLTDFWMEGGTRADFLKLIKPALKEELSKEHEDHPEVSELVSVNVMDSFDSTLVDRPLSMSVTVTGKRIPSYLIPEVITMKCDMSFGKKCESCPMNEREGEWQHTIHPQDPLILHLINVQDTKMVEAIRKELDITKCPKLKHTVQKHRTVEEVYVRPSIEDGPTQAEQDFTHRRVISSASHDLSSNQSVILTGTIRPHPTNQANEFQAWSVMKPETGLDSFSVSKDIREEMDGFKTEDPLEMLGFIAKDMSIHHTQVYGRPDLHTFMDLVFHSVLQFKFGGSKKLEKGWLDGVIIGDTRTGKTKVAESLVDLYGAGEMISCEAASFAGVVGGLDRMGDNKWIVKWGSIPVNDRRIVILDEVSGLSTEQISAMSSIRSSGVAELTKIQNERARARTRLIWLANPRNEQMSDIAYGVYALERLIGNPEDIARFDIAMGAFRNDVKVTDINKQRKVSATPMFSTEAYRSLLRWAWTRKPDDISWTTSARELTLESANDMGGRYVESPPLIQGANAREKISRMSAAIAARTYSTTDGSSLVVDDHHVQAAVDFMDRVYSNPGFGYRAISDQKLSDLRATENNLPQILAYVASKPNFTRFLLNSPIFTKYQIMGGLNVGDEEAGTIVNMLWSLRATDMDRNTFKLSPIVISELRGVIIA